MKTERESRLAAELALHSEELLNTRCRDIQNIEAVLDRLAAEVGYGNGGFPPAKTYLTNNGDWSSTLREAVTDLVTLLYTFDRVYDTIAEVEEASYKYTNAPFLKVGLPPD